MELSVSGKKFLCVEHPAIVKNEEKMLHTLGGESTLMKTYNDPSKRFELKLRPDDYYCKPACGDRHSATSFILKVRRRKVKTSAATKKTKTDSISGTVIENGYEYQGEMLGIVDTSIKFQSMCDYQYLQMERLENSADSTVTHKSIVEQLSLSPTEGSSWLKKPASLFLPPPVYARIDTPVDYCFRDGPQPKNSLAKDSIKNHTIGVSRNRRPHYTKFFNFEDKDVPNEPYSEAIAKLNSKLRDTSKLDEVKLLFEERPIWSKNALIRHLKVPVNDQLKYLLPAVAFYHMVGPWGRLWNKFGYDPRKDSSSKIYQSLDFRFRTQNKGSIHPIPRRKVLPFNMPTKVVNKSSTRPRVIEQDTFHEGQVEDVPERLSEKKIEEKDNTYKFWPHCLPAFKQIFYQLCDICLDEAQELIHVNDGKETECTERDGWCLPDAIDSCRQMMTTHMNSLLTKSGFPQLETKISKMKMRLKNATVAQAKTISSTDSINEEASDTIDVQQSTTNMELTASGSIDEPQTITMDVDLPSSSEEEDEEVEEEEQNPMQTELLEYMDPDF